MKALVTGGGGFLGSAIVSALRKRGDTVSTIQRGDYPFLTTLGAKVLQGDLTRFDDVDAAASDCDVVFHVAAKAGVWGDYEAYYKANVVATKNVIKACQKHNINHLVYTSTPSVVFDGRSEEGIDESKPYTKKFFNAYQKTKMEAEKRILDFNSSSLKTVALRPHLIWGPGDRHLAPRIIERAKTGRLRLVGKLENRVDSCYIDNAVQAHLLAADNLQKNGVCAGKAYFISNNEPVTMPYLINKILAAANLPPVTKRLNENMAYVLGATFERIYSLFNITQEPVMTRFVARQLSTSHWFDLTAAQQDLKYQPLISIDEGMKRLREALTTA